MLKRIHEILGVTELALKEKGVFDGFMDIDENFYVDPSLLESTSIPEFQHSARLFKDYFQDIITLLKQAKSTEEKDLFFRGAKRRLIFPELESVSLGSSTKGNSGRGIGEILASRIANTAWQIVKAGTDDPKIFELVGLFEEKVGADRISDMTIRIILPDLLAYSQRVAESLGVRTKVFDYEDKKFLLPVDPDKNSSIILLPKELLRDLLIANDWSEIEAVCAQNEQLRNRTNHLIETSWKELIHSLSKTKFKKLLLGNPELLQRLLEDYKNKPATQYDFENDPAGYFSWQDLGRQFSANYPLKLDLREVTSENILQVVLTICAQFKTLIEDNGLAIHLWKDDRKSTRNERFAQLLFFAIADSYCDANNLDLSREPNAGRGPVDFKVSKGYRAKVTVEIKFTSNDIKSGYSNQLSTYNTAEKTEHSIFLVIINSKSTLGLQAVKKLQEEEKLLGKKPPEIFVVDGMIQDSASKI